MIRKPIVIASLLTSMLVSVVGAQTTTRTVDPLAIERQTREIAPQIVAATVGIVLTKDDLEPSGIGYGGSGVIVNPEGLILTAAHVLKGAEEEVIVLLEGKEQVKARICGYLGRGDLGLIQLQGAGPWPFLPMADVEKVSPGTVCVGAGHTGRIDPQRPPPLRMGRVLGERTGESFIDEKGDAADLDRVLVTDAPFLPGDSGGPLVNLAGEVIGVHSSIGPDHRENLHVPVWQFKRHWAKLTGGVKRPLPKFATDAALDYGTQMGPFRKLTIFDHRITVERSWSGCHANFLKKYARYIEPAAAVTAQVFADNRPVALGTVVRSDGLIATLATSVASGKLACRLGEKDYEAKVVARDEAHNLALLQIAAEKLPAVPWSEEENPAIGAWVVSAGPQGLPLGVGIVGGPLRAIAAPQADESESYGFLGVELQTKAKDARVGRVVPTSAAATAGISPSDVIHAVNEHAIRHGDDLIETLHRYQPGEKVKIEIARAGERLQLEVMLGKRPSREQEDDAEFAAWNRSSGGVSLRKTNLPEVLTHDGCISPRHCGGPVLDLQGRVVGLNIARDDRTATFALPAATVVQVVERMSVAARGE